MTNLAVRFTVRNKSGQRAATWKCWSQPSREDVYLACRELGGALKTSLHESGRWHTAYFEGFFEEEVPDELRSERGRFIDQWQRSKPIARGVTLAYRVVTPWSSVTTPDNELASLVRVPAPSEGRAIEFDVFLLDKGVTGWPGRNSMKTELVGSYALQSGSTVSVVSWEIAMPALPPLQGKPKFFRGRSMDDLKSNTGLRILAFGAEPDGSKVIYDCFERYEDRDQSADG